MWMYVKSKVRYRACSGTSPFTFWKSLERSSVRPLQNASNCTLDHFQDHFEKFHFQYAMVLPPQFCYHEIPQSISSNFDIQIYYYDIPKYLILHLSYFLRPSSKAMDLFNPPILRLIMSPISRKQRHLLHLQLPPRWVPCENGCVWVSAELQELRVDWVKLPRWKTKKPQETWIPPVYQSYQSTLCQGKKFQTHVLFAHPPGAMIQFEFDEDFCKCWFNHPTSCALIFYSVFFLVFVGWLTMGGDFLWIGPVEVPSRLQRSRDLNHSPRRQGPEVKANFHGRKKVSCCFYQWHLGEAGFFRVFLWVDPFKMGSWRDPEIKSHSWRSLRMFERFGSTILSHSFCQGPT